MLGVVNVEEAAVLAELMKPVEKDSGDPEGGDPEELECESVAMVEATEGLQFVSRDDLRGPDF